MIMKCDCENKFQDETYGKGMRVFTVGMKKNSCTVCGKAKDATVKEKKAATAQKETAANQ